MITFNFESVVSSNREPYNNVAAHEELKSMMSRFDRLNIFFFVNRDEEIVSYLQEKELIR